jgi:hypothetical protein
MLRRFFVSAGCSTYEQGMNMMSGCYFTILFC